MRDLAILLASAATAPVFAQSTGDYPVRPIHFVIPNTVGGTSDILARLIGSRLSDAIGQPVIVESRPGAAGRIALDYMGKAAPDGYTILLGNNGTNAIVPGAQSVDAADDPALVPVIKLASLAIVIAATPRVEAKSLSDVIERARRKPDSLAYASSGIGSTSHMAAALLSQRAGIKMLQIPYAGTASAVKDEVWPASPFSAGISAAATSQMTVNVPPILVTMFLRVQFQRLLIRSMASGYRAPWIVICDAVLSISARSSAVSCTSAAWTFSSSRCNFVVPGIGTIHGCRARSQASAI